MNLAVPSAGIQKPFVAGRTRGMAASASNAAGQRARELAAAGRSIINMTLGEPDFETPENIKQAGIRAIVEGQTRYTTADGTPAMKAAAAAKFGRDNGLVFTPDQITIASGAKQIVFNALMATVDEGDEVIIPAPHWVSYPEMVRFAGGVPVALTCGANQGFKLTADQLEAAITPRTKWLILNSPCNPTGAVLSADELRSLGDVLARHPHVWVLTDDIYEHIRFGPEPFATMASVAPALASRTLTVNGVSKAHAMTGWRIGFAGGPRELIVEIAKIQSQSTSNPCSISQVAAIEALTGPQDHVSRFREAYHSRRDLVMRELSRIPGLVCSVPEGAFYAFPSCAAFIGRQAPNGRVVESDVDFSAHLLEYGVASVASQAFGIDNHVRLSIATSEDLLLEGCRRIAAACTVL